MGGGKRKKKKSQTHNAISDALNLVIEHVMMVQSGADSRTVTVFRIGLLGLFLLLVKHVLGLQAYS